MSTLRGEDVSRWLAKAGRGECVCVCGVHRILAAALRLGGDVVGQQTLPYLAVKHRVRVV
jgi:hypothetical protein